MDIGPAFPEKNIPVAFAADDNYLPYVAVAINSLVAKTASSNLDVLVLHDGISEIAKAGFFTGVRKDERLSVRFVDIGDTVRGTAARSFVQKNYLSVTALFRLFIPKVLTAYDALPPVSIQSDAYHLVENVIGEIPPYEAISDIAKSTVDQVGVVKATKEGARTENA